MYSILLIQSHPNLPSYHHLHLRDSKGLVVCLAREARFEAEPLISLIHVL